MAANPRPPEVKTHPLYERIAERLAEQLGENGLMMADDQDAHLVAFIATAEAMNWITEKGLS